MKLTPSIYIALIGGLAVLPGCATSPSDTIAVETPPAEPMEIAPVSEPAPIAQQAVPVATETSVSGAPAAPAEVKGLKPELVYAVLLAELAAQRGKFVTAYQHYYFAAKTARDAKLALRATRIALFLKAQKQSLESARLWVSLEPDNDEAHQVVALLLLREGLPEQALEHFKRLLEHDQATRESRLLQIAAFLAKEEPSIPSLNLMKSLNSPESASGFHAVAVVAAAAGDRPATIDAARDALALDAKRPRVRLLLGASLVSVGKTKEGIEQMRQAADAAPDDVLVNLSYAQSLREVELLPEARQAYEAVLKQKPEQVEARIAVGDLSLVLRDLDAAQMHFEALKDHESYGDLANYQLGRVHLLRRDLPEADRWFARVGGKLALDARSQQASIRGKRGDVEGAQVDFQALWATAEKDDRVSLAISESSMLSDAGRNEQAIGRLDRALKIIPENEDLLYARAMMGVKAGNIDILERDLRAVLKLNPDNTDALNALGYTLADNNTRLDEAEKYILKAYELAPNSAAVLDSMGWLKYRLGDAKQALGYIKRAHRLYPDGEIAAHLGEILWFLGRQDEAGEIWQEALRHDPDSKALLETIRRFKN